MTSQNNGRPVDGLPPWPRVGVRFDFMVPMGHQMLAGVLRYMLGYGPWLLHAKERIGLGPLGPQLIGLGPMGQQAAFHGDGMIAHVIDDLERYHEVPYPVVNVGTFTQTDLPSVTIDNVAIGRIAAEHLAECGFTTLAFRGFQHHLYSHERLNGVEQVVNERGLSLVAQISDVSQPYLERLTHDFYITHIAEISEWLRGLPKPVGIVAASDGIAYETLMACLRADIAVPEEVAIIGVDNHEVLCNAAHPSLSSVINPFEQVGYEAAALLDRLMAGEAAPLKPIRIPPVGVAVRQSTDVCAIDDEKLAQALRFIRENASKPITIEDVLDAVPVSRRSMERRFREHLDRTPLEEISRVRVEQAKRLLAATDLSIAAIASRCGFTEAERLSVVFKRRTGQTPSEYRRGMRSMNDHLSTAI